MLKIIKNARVYAPENLGTKQVLVAGEKIVAIDDKFDIRGVPVEEFDAQGKVLTPGFIDQHVHITGGGGQTGFASMVPEVGMSELVACGTTTVVGLLGTDGFVKSLGALYAKAKALDMDGLTAYMLTSYYGIPEKTITGSVAEDLIYIDKVIGCKLAISDDRSSFPTEQEVLRLLNQVRLGGFTSAKTGVLHIHLGNLPTGIDLLLAIARQVPAFVQYLSPTHVIRTEPLFEQSLEFARIGGMIDISTGGTKFTAPHLAVLRALEAGISPDCLTFSSDGRGGVRKIDPATGEDSYRPAPLHLNHKEMALLVENGLPLETALKLITTSPAKNLKIKGKGAIKVGFDADFCLMDDSLALCDVFARGRQVMREGVVTGRGSYEL